MKSDWKRARSSPAPLRSRGRGSAIPYRQGNAQRPVRGSRASSPAGPARRPAVMHFAHIGARLGNARNAAHHEVVRLLAQVALTLMFVAFPARADGILPLRKAMRGLLVLLRQHLRQILIIVDETSELRVIEMTENQAAIGLFASEAAGLRERGGAEMRRGSPATHPGVAITNIAVEVSNESGGTLLCLWEVGRAFVRRLARRPFAQELRAEPVGAVLLRLRARKRQAARAHATDALIRIFHHLRQATA